MTINNEHIAKSGALLAKQLELNNKRLIHSLSCIASNNAGYFSGMSAEAMQTKKENINKKLSECLALAGYEG